jgi:hypothetical protein
VGSKILILDRVFKTIESFVNLLSAIGVDNTRGFVEVPMRIIEAGNKTSKANSR